MRQSYTQTYNCGNTHTNYSLMHSSGMSLKENLKRLMEANGLNPNSLAEKSGVTQPTIFRILSGESKDPRRANVERLAKFFAVDIEEMYAAVPDTQYHTFKTREPENNPYGKTIINAVFSKQEQLLIDGFRVADPTAQGILLDIAQKALDVFDQRNEQNS